MSTRDGDLLEGAVAIVSGGARGIGEATGRRLHELGAAVILADVQDQYGHAVADSMGSRTAYVHLDVRDERGWDQVVAQCEERFGPVTVLVNNAATTDFGPLADTDLDDYLRVVEVNQFGCFLGMRAVVPSMERAGGGSIVNISSMNGIVARAGTIAYTASKWAIRGMTRAAAMELGPRRIRVNSVHPGAVDTDMLREAESAGLVTAPERRRLAEAVPLGRSGRTDEIADLVAFLVSARASYSTGSEFVIDGGVLAGPSGRQI